MKTNDLRVFKSDCPTRNRYAKRQVQLGFSYKTAWIKAFIKYP